MGYGGDIVINLLGRFEVVVDGVPVLDRSWGRRKARALLGLLALQRGHSLHREQVLDALWPDMSLAAAANNLHKNVHHLRSALAERGATTQLVEVAGDLVRLADAVRVDVDVFRDLAQRARTARHDPYLYEQALALYQGDLLPEELYEDWAALKREELRDLCVHLLIELARLDEAHGRLDAAVARFERILDCDALHEEAHRELMRLYALTGSRHHALRQYQLCRSALARELGVEPSAETEALYREIVAGRIQTMQPQEPRAAVARRQHDTPPSPFYDREREMELAEDLLDRALSGRGTALFVGGVGGIGKTRFAEQVILVARDAHPLVLRGRCYQFEATLAYQPLRDMLTQAIDQLPSEVILRQVHRSLHLRRLLPTTELDPPPTADPGTLQLELFTEISRLLTDAAARQPVIAVVDDLHAADEASLRFVHFLCRQISTHRVFLLATYRADEVTPDTPLARLLASLSHERLAHEIVLEPLPDRAMELLVEQFFDGERVDRDLVTEVVRIAEGNPFFAREVVQTILHEGSARPTGRRWRRPFGEGPPVPRAVHAILDRRLLQVGEPARRLLQTASLLGRSFDYQLLRRVLDEPEQDILDSLDDGIAAFVLEEAPDGYRFRHDLLREAIRGRLTRARRQQLHRRIAEALLAGATGHAAVDPEAIGYHLIESDEPWRGAEYLAAAAARAAAVYANEEALALYQRALELLDSYPSWGSNEQRITVLEGLGDLLRRAGKLDDSIACYTRALALAESGGDDARALWMRGKVALSHIIQGDIAAASALLGTTLQAMGDQAPTLAVARTYYLLAQLHWHSADYGAALDAAERALLVAETAGDAGSRARAYEALALAYHSLGDWRRGVACELQRCAIGVPGFDTDEAFDAHL